MGGTLLCCSMSVRTYQNLEGWVHSTSGSQNPSLSQLPGHKPRQAHTTQYPAPLPKSAEMGSAPHSPTGEKKPRKMLELVSLARQGLFLKKIITYFVGFPREEASWITNVAHPLVPSAFGLPPHPPSPPCPVSHAIIHYNTPHKHSKTQH